MKVRKKGIKETKLENEYLCIHFPALLGMTPCKLSKKQMYNLIRKAPGFQELSPWLSF
jgi:hypothetical protein